jgi:adenine-specific DNA-methyltransferase
MTVWKYTEVGHSQDATQKLAKLFDGKKLFDYPKSVPLIIRILQLYTNKDSIVLDFFSGSATTAHAVMQLNAEDGGNRQFILVQLPEATDNKSVAYQNGYKTICEIGKERIRRAAKKIKEETGADIDYGFRVLKLDSSNMEDVYYAPAEVKQEQMSLFAENVKYGRTSKDLLFQTMLELGATLDSKIEETKINDKVIYNVADGYLVACFDTEVSDDVVKAIAQMEPQYAVLRDSSLADDSTATNFDQIFKTYSPTTTCKIL